MSKYEAVIGLEVHAQLSTRTKLFCGCAAAYGAAPNTLVCPVCLGLPGALPVLNRRAVEYAIRMGLAAGCTVAGESVFARKNYFYPDCPKNYQISQYETALCTGGKLSIDGGKREIRITRIHLEEDAGKLIHDGGGASYVDFNRSGIPLIEIVTEPDIRSPREASGFLQKLRSIVRYLGICDGNMEEGSLRCDVNISLRRAGVGSFGTQTEIKNVNSFKFVERALEYEIERQSKLLDAGGEVGQNTMLWDAQKGETRILRSKEGTQDYRYFPEPDLPVLKTPESLVSGIAASLPELPDARERRFVEQYDLPAYNAGVLTGSRALADYFEAVVDRAGDTKESSNWVMGEVLRALKERNIEVEDFPVAPEDLGELIEILRSERINTTTARDVFREMLDTGRNAGSVIAEEGLEQIDDAQVIAHTARKVLDDNPDAVSKFFDGKEGLLKFFVGQVMKETRGKANPRTAETIIRDLLERRR